MACAVITRYIDVRIGIAPENSLSLAFLGSGTTLLEIWKDKSQDPPIDDSVDDLVDFLTED